MKLSLSKLIPLKKMLEVLPPVRVEALCGRPIHVVKAAADGLDISLRELNAITVGIDQWERGQP